MERVRRPVCPAGLRLRAQAGLAGRRRGRPVARRCSRAVAGAVGRLDYDPRRGAFRNWLFTVVRRKLSNWRRGPEEPDARQRRYRDPASFWNSARRPDARRPSGRPSGSDRLFAWACEQVRRDVTDATWQAFWRTAVDGQPGKQVAADLGLSVAAVYHARSRVLARLKELVQSVQEP